MTDLLPLRVMVQDVWDEVQMELPLSAPVGEIKRRALALTRVRRDPAGYVIKFRGAELIDEDGPIGESGLVPNGAVIVLPRRRRPVR